jgi:tetratricopeptide (TPR) repeat protein
MDGSDAQTADFVFASKKEGSMDYLLSDPNYSVLQNTLRAWRNDVALAASPLASLALVEASRREQPSTADALRKVLLDAIKQLKPAKGAVDWQSPAWQPYLIFHAQTVDGWSHTRLAAELAVSKSEYYRLRRKALAQLAETLAVREHEAQHQRARRGFHARILAEFPHQLPMRDADCFVGREAVRNRVLGEIREAIQRRRVVRIALFGLPGVGKSLLAAELAADVQLQDAVSAVIWLNAGKGATAENLLVELAHAIRAGAIDENTSNVSYAERISETLAGQPIILFVDDVWNADCIRPLAQMKDIAALVTTTRLPMIAHDPVNTSAIHVEELRMDDCIEVFRHYAPDVVDQARPAIEALIELCGNLPMAITLAAKQLRRHAYGGQMRRALQIVEHLRDREQRLALHEDADPTARSLEAMIETSLSQLNPQSRAALAPLAALAPSPHTFSLEAFCAVTGEGSEIMDELTDFGFVEPQINDRYRLHQSLADYFLAKGECDDACQMRAAAYFAEIALENQMRYAVLVQEWPNMLKILHTAQAFGWTPHLAKAGCVMVDYMHSVGLMSEAILWSDYLAVACAKLGDAALLIRANCIQAKVLLDSGRGEEAENLFLRAIHLAQAFNILDNLPAAYEGMAMIARARNDPMGASAYASQAVAAADATGQSTYIPRLLAMQHFHTLSNMAHDKTDIASIGRLLRSPAMRGWMFGLLLYMRGRPTQSVRVLHAALQQAQSSGDPSAEITIRAFMSIVLVALARFDDSEQMAQVALTLKDHVLLPRSLGFCYLSIGHARYVWGQFDAGIRELLNWHAESMRAARFESAALALLQAAQCALYADSSLLSAVSWSQDSLGLLKVTGQSEFVPFPLATGALAQAKLGNMSEAQRLFDQAERLATLDHAQNMHVRALLGEALLLDRQYIRAERLCRDLIRSAERFGFDEVSADAHFVLAQALVAQGQSHESGLVARRAVEQYAMLRHFRHGMAAALVRSLEGNAHDAIPMPMPQTRPLGR